MCRWCLDLCMWYSLWYSLTLGEETHSGWSTFTRWVWLIMVLFEQMYRNFWFFVCHTHKKVSCIIFFECFLVEIIQFWNSVPEKTDIWKNPDCRVLPATSLVLYWMSHAHDESWLRKCGLFPDVGRVGAFVWELLPHWQGGHNLSIKTSDFKIHSQHFLWVTIVLTISYQSALIVLSTKEYFK